MRLIVLTVPLLILPAVALADPGGVDAPDAWDAALDVPLGVVEGDLGGNDTADWYRVTGSANAFRITIQMPDVDGYYLEVTDDRGWWIDYEYLWSWNAPITATLLVPNGGPTRVGLYTYRDEAVPAAYALTVEAFEAPDGALTGIRVDNVEDVAWPLTTDFEPTTGTQRVITVAVANVADVPFTGRVDVTTAGRTYGTQYVGSATVSLAPGETTNVTLPWSALGAGDMEVTARLHVDAWEPNAWNNLHSIEHYLVAGDLGPGVLLPASTCGPTLLGYGACAGTGGASVAGVGGLTWAAGSDEDGAWVETCLTGRVHGCSHYAA